MRGHYSTPSRELVGTTVPDEITVRVVSSNPWKDMLLGAAVGFAFTKVLDQLLDMRAQRKKAR